MKNFSLAITILFCFMALGQEKKDTEKKKLIIRDIPSIIEYDDPIYVVDGKVVSVKQVKKIKPLLIDSLTILKNDSTIFCSGRKPVIIIKTKKLSRGELRKMKKSKG